MSIVLKICLSTNSGSIMQEVNEVSLFKNRGILEDRYYSENNDSDIQLTLIEKENIDFYNQITNSDIPYIDFRRNIITEGVKLNDLVNKDFFVGDVKVRGHRLCEPCKYLQDKLKQPNLVKNLVNKGGLRCEILSDGKISIKDKIKTI